MKLIVGLGNPGPKYEVTRHNIGFLAIDYLVDQWKAQGPVVKNQAVYWQATVDGEQVLLVKPQTFYQFYKCEPKDLIVLHDELDIDPLEIRFKVGGSHGGHNGLRSIDECLGAMDTGYTRVRLGIGHPRNFNARMDVADYVLGKIPDPEWEELVPLFEKVDGGIRLILRGKLQEAMNKFHGKPKEKSEK
jgi:PTH1 family peptidyl-tRNA hydrolase